MRVLAVIFLIPFVWGCSGPKPPDFSNFTLFNHTPEEKLRSDITRKWESCQSTQSGSTKYVLSVASDKELTIKAHAFKEANCSGGTYETYKLAVFSSSQLTASSESHGQAKVTLKIYYPQNKSFEEGITKLNSKVISQADAAFNVSPDTQSLTLTLKNIEVFETLQLSSNSTVLKRKENVLVTTNAAVTMTFSASKSRIWPMYSNLKTHYYLLSNDSVVEFANTESAKQYVLSVAQGVIEPTCINDYFSKDLAQAKNEPLLDQSTNIFFNRRDHLELIKEGFVADGVQIQDLEDLKLRPYIVFSFYYSTQTEGWTEGSHLACPNKVRPSGLKVE